jgi:predicted HTH transcriptional regulator
MDFFDTIFGLKKIKTRLNSLEKRIEKLESLMREEFASMKETEDKILKLLEKPRTTDEVASLINLSRSRTSFILNKLEKEGKAKEQGMKGREILYVRV